MTLWLVVYSTLTHTIMIAQAYTETTRRYPLYTSSKDGPVTLRVAECGEYKMVSTVTQEDDEEWKVEGTKETRGKGIEEGKR